MVLTPRDREILTTLTDHLQVLSHRQIVEACWRDGPPTWKNAWRRMARLVELGLLARLTVMARPVPPLDRPLCTWNPGDPYPDVEAISYAARKRWLAPPERTVVYLATEKARRLFGAGRRLKLKSVQIGHALGVSESFLHLRRSAPTLSERWVIEPDDIDASRIPDAVLLDSRRRPVHFLDYLGAYLPQRLHDLHQAAASTRASYSWW